MSLWCQHALAELAAGRAATLRPRGHSMAPKVRDRAYVELEPVVAETELNVGDVVLCRVRGRYFLHLITALDSQGRVQIGNARGHINGWIGRAAVFGRATAIDNNG
jgi:hypothetical protein